MFLKPKLGTSQVFHMAQQIFEKLALEREFPTRRKADFSVPFKFMASRLKMRHSLIVISDVVDMLNDQASVDFKLLRMLAAKHDMMFFILDDPQEFQVRRPLGYIRSLGHGDRKTDRDLGSEGPVRFGGRLRSPAPRSNTPLKHRCGIDSVVLTPDNHIEELPKFLISRTAR